MKYVLCVAMLCCFAVGVSSQFDSIPEFGDDYYTSMKDLRESEKFRIGVDISTPTVGFLAGANMRPRASLIFNKKIAPNRALRFVPAFERNRRFTDYRTATYTATSVNDSSVVFRNEYTEEYRVSARFGMEWFKQYEKNSMVYGIDAVLGYHSELCSYQQTYRNYNEDGIIQDIIVGQAFFDRADFFNEEIFRLILGIDFSIGYRVFLGEKTDLTIEWIPELSYRPYFSKKSYGELEVLPTASSGDEMVFDIRGLNVQLHYKFLKKK